MWGKSNAPRLILFSLCTLALATQGAAQTPIKYDIELHLGGIGTDGANAIVPLSDGGFALGGWKSKDGESDLTESWVGRQFQPPRQD